MSDDERIQKRKADILAAAGEVFEAHGYAAAKVEDIAARAGISKGSIYNYFPSKREIFTEMVDSVVAVHEADLQRELDGLNSWTDRLMLSVDWWLNRMEEFCRLGGVILECWAILVRHQGQGEFADAFHEMYERGVSRLEGILAGGVAAGEFRRTIRPRIGAILMNAMMDGIFVQAILGMPIKLDAEFHETMKQGLLASLRSESDEE